MKPLEGLDLLMKYISKAKYIVALTGAGISTSAGIPDFRGPNGLYANPDIQGEKLFGIDYFKKDPAFFYKNIADIFETILKAEPTKGHILLKKLEDMGKLKTVITQNIDGLHQKAGNSYVLEIHGNFETFYCINCNTEVAIDSKITKTVKSKKAPKCKSCGGTLKPNIVFFGEPVQGLEKALTEMQKADLLIALGTTLTVYPVSTLPSYIADDTKFAIINMGNTPYDHKADIVINEDINIVAEKTKFI